MTRARASKIRAGRDRQALAPQHPATVEAPRVDAEEQRARRSRRGRAGSGSCPTAARRPGPRGRVRAPARSVRDACRRSARPTPGRAGAAGRGPRQEPGDRSRPGLVHARLHAQLLARRQPERPARRSGAGADRGHHEHEQRQGDQRPRPATERPRKGETVGSASARSSSRPATCAASSDRPSATLRGADDDHPVAACGGRPPPTTRPPGPGPWRTNNQSRTTSCAPISPGGADDERRRPPSSGPGLEQPREVERGEHERAEVLGDRPDRVDGGLFSRQQLAAAATAHRRADAEQQEAGQRRPGAGPRAGAADRPGSPVDPAPAPRPRRTVTATGPRPPPCGDPRSAYGRARKRSRCRGRRRRPPSGGRLSRGAHGRPRVGRQLVGVHLGDAGRHRAARSRSRRPPGRGRAGAWRAGCRRRGRGRRRSPRGWPRRRSGRRRRRARRAAGRRARAARRGRRESRRPMPWLKPPATRWATSPSSKRSSRSRARASHSGDPTQPGGELEVLPRGRARDEPADVGAVADQPLDRERVERRRRAGHEHGARGGRYDARQHLIVVDLPAPLRPSSAVARPESAAGGRCRRRPPPRRSARAGRGRRSRGSPAHRLPPSRRVTGECEELVQTGHSHGTGSRRTIGEVGCDWNLVSLSGVVEVISHQEAPMEEESIGFGRVSDRRDGPTLRDVFDASYRRLVVQLYGVTGNLDEAEDLVQEAFVRAAAIGRRFRRGGQPRGVAAHHGDQRPPQPLAQAAQRPACPGADAPAPRPAGHRGAPRPSSPPSARCPRTSAWRSCSTTSPTSRSPRSPPSWVFPSGR